MGTNYYRVFIDWVKCPYCNDCYYWRWEKQHIGKVSWGWKFHFHYEAFIYPEDWKKELLFEKWYIVDEYNKHMTRKTFIVMVERLQSVKEPERTASERKFVEMFPRHKPLNYYGYLFYKGEWS